MSQGDSAADFSPNALEAMCCCCCSMFSGGRMTVNVICALPLREQCSTSPSAAAQVRAGAKWLVAKCGSFTTRTCKRVTTMNSVEADRCRQVRKPSSRNLPFSSLCSIALPRACICKTASQMLCTEKSTLTYVIYSSSDCHTAVHRADEQCTSPHATVPMFSPCKHAAPRQAACQTYMQCC